MADVAGARKDRSLLSSAGDALTTDDLAEIERLRDPTYRRLARIRGYKDAELQRELEARGFRVKKVRPASRPRALTAGQENHVLADLAVLESFVGLKSFPSGQLATALRRPTDDAYASVIAELHGLQSPSSVRKLIRRHRKGSIDS